MKLTQLDTTPPSTYLLYPAEGTDLCLYLFGLLLDLNPEELSLALEGLVQEGKLTPKEALKLYDLFYPLPTRKELP